MARPFHGGLAGPCGEAAGMQRLLDDAGRFVPGCYRQALEDPDFGPARSKYPRFLRRMRLKEWHFFGVSSPTHYLAVAVVHAGYLGTVFCYVVDRATGQVREYGRRTPFGWGVRMAPSSTRGETRFRWGRERISIVSHPDRWTVELDLPLARGRFEVLRDEPLALVYPLCPTRAAYTHKEAGNRVRGAVGDMVFEPESSFAVTDWTRSYADRRTVWNWLSVGGLSTDGRRVGLNLSARVYRDAESAIWVDGTWRPVGPVEFEVPPDGQGLWRVRGEGLDLRVEARGARRERLNLGILAAGLTQAFGPITGRVGDVELGGVFGVVEDHLALW